MAAAILIAHLPPMRRAGRAMLWAVAGFGLATIVFGLSRSFWLSFLMLALTGAFDNVSVVVRHTLIQALPPDNMRGRVTAVNIIFIGASNELGAFESGATAAWWGPQTAVVVGGIGTVLVVALIALLSPQVRRFGSLRDVAAASAGVICSRRHVPPRGAGDPPAFLNEGQTRARRLRHARRGVASARDQRNATSTTTGRWSDPRPTPVSHFVAVSCGLEVHVIDPDARA